MRGSRAILRATLAVAFAGVFAAAATPARAGLFAIIQPVKICAAACNEPIFDTEDLSDFFEREAGITLKVLAPRLLFRPDFATLTGTTLDRLLSRNLIGQTVAENGSAGGLPPELALEIYFSRASFFNIWGAAAGIGGDFGWVTTNNIVGGDLARRSAFQTQVMAHEIGHMLGLEHLLDLANIMHPSGGPSVELLDYELNEAQAAIARASRYVVDIPAPAALVLLLGALACLAPARFRKPAGT